MVSPSPALPSFPAEGRGAQPWCDQEKQQRPVLKGSGELLFAKGITKRIGVAKPSWAAGRM